jgi:hypothetical protein
MVQANQVKDFFKVGKNNLGRRIGHLSLLGGADYLEACNNAGDTISVCATAEGVYQKEIPNMRVRE